MLLIGFAILAFLAILSAATVVTHRNPVVCALALAFHLVAIAGFYLLLDAQFIALLQVIVYAGAIMVLVLFVVMLLNLPDEMRGRPSGPLQRFLGPVLALLFAAILAQAFLRFPGIFRAKEAGFGTVESVGRELYGRFFYPFEVVSLLLVVAMVGAVLLAKRKV